MVRNVNYTVDPMIQVDMDYSPAFTHWGMDGPHTAGSDPECSLCDDMSKGISHPRWEADRARIGAAIARDYAAWQRWLKDNRVSDPHGTTASDPHTWDETRVCTACGETRIDYVDFTSYTARPCVLIAPYTGSTPDCGSCGAWQRAAFIAYAPSFQSSGYRIVGICRECSRRHVANGTGAWADNVPMDRR